MTTKGDAMDGRDQAMQDDAGAMETGEVDMTPAEWQVRATAWELLSLSFAYPAPELVGAVASGEWVAASLEVAEAIGAELPDDFGAELPHAGAAVDEDALLHALRAEATRLFVGAPKPVCSPYEGIWRADDEGVQPLLFVNPHSMDVERFMKSCGLGRPEGTNDPLDHASTECALLEHLAAIEAEIAQPSPALDGGAAALPGGSAHAAYARFLDEHVATWMPRFAEHVGAETRHPFFRDAAHLMTATIRAIG